MNSQSEYFVIPTYRLREVGNCIEQYDDHLWRNGHAMDIYVFDDSTRVAYEKYYPLLEKTQTHNRLFYVGPDEKSQFISYLISRLRDKHLEGAIRNLFRPSYGGNRNVTLMYSLGGLLISCDDDMRPFALMEHSLETLEPQEVSRGRLRKHNENGYLSRSFDIVGSFLDVLSKPVHQVPSNYAHGDFLIDSAMHLETNASQGLARENSLFLKDGSVDDHSIVKIAQTFRSGTNDVDALDFAELFLSNDDQLDPDELNDQYVLANFRPVITNCNWRMDCGVAGYDNTFGLPPFFPTGLRFEDYIFRLWIQQPRFAAAHVDAAQNHCKSNYMRNPIPAEVFNEELCTLLKQKIKNSITSLDELSITFGYDGHVTAQDAEAILSKIKSLDQRIQERIRTTEEPGRRTALQTFAANLHKAFYAYEPDFFHQNLQRIAGDVVNVIKGSLELWPTLVEIVYFEKNRHGLPRREVMNQRIR